MEGKSLSLLFPILGEGGGDGGRSRERAGFDCPVVTASVAQLDAPSDWRHIFPNLAGFIFLFAESCFFLPSNTSWHTMI